MRLVRRLLGLVLVSLIIYNLEGNAKPKDWNELLERGWVGMFAVPLKRTWFQTLMHIAVTSLWIVPVISRGQGIRWLWLLGSGIAHVLLSYWFNFTWCNTAPNAIDGGPLGFLTWCIPALLGTMACDWFADGLAAGQRATGTVSKAILVAVAFMGAGYLLSCPTRLYDVPADQIESLKGVRLAPDPVWPSQRSNLATGLAWAEPPFVRPPGTAERKWNYWMMSQRAGTLSYTTFAAGFSLLVFVVFFVVCDRVGWQWSVFRTFGTNALMAYVLHSLVSNALQPFFPNDSPAWFAYLGLLLFFFINWLFLRALEKQGVYLRV